MLLRLAEFALLLGALGWASASVWRLFRAPPVRATQQAALTAQELKDLRARAATHNGVKEALALRDGMRAFIGDVPDVGDAVDAALRQLSAEAALLEGIERALVESNEARRAADVLAAQSRLRDATSADERALAQDILAGLERQRTATEALERRRDLVTGSIARAVIELREIRLALLDAAASPAGLASGAAAVVSRLRDTTERLTTLARAGDDVELLVQGPEEATATQPR